MAPIDFTGQVAVVTGGGGGLGKAYSKLLAQRGAKVVLNDFSKAAADKAIEEIKALGVPGDLVANYDDVANGDRIVEQAVKLWGRIDIVINNAGITLDKSFKAMTDEQWNRIYRIHTLGAYKTCKAAWPYMRSQKFGRIINTASIAGISGNFGQANYAAAKFGLVGFSKSLAKEGAKYNIFVNSIAPSASSEMTKSVMTPEEYIACTPDSVAPHIVYLLSKESTATGRLFGMGANWFGEIRWERSKGVVFRTDETFTPGAVKARWNEVISFDKDVEYPNADAQDPHAEARLLEAKNAPPNKSAGEPSFRGQTIIITGAGAGLGRAYAHTFAKGGGNIVLNDMNGEAAEKVAKEVEKLGGNAVVSVGSAEAGEKLVQLALTTFGSLEVVVANAGILRDKSFLKMSDAEWDAIYSVHLHAVWALTHAAWPIMQKAKYGRIILTTSAVGLHGNHGQANYSSAKAAVVGLGKTLSIEGKKYGILVNTIAPIAGTALTKTVFTEEMVNAFLPDLVAPVVGYLASRDSQQTNALLEVGGGWVSRYQWGVTKGKTFYVDRKTTPEDIRDNWEEITRFGGTTVDAHIVDVQSYMAPQTANFKNFTPSTAKL